MDKHFVVKYADLVKSDQDQLAKQNRAMLGNLERCFNILFSVEPIFVLKQLLKQRIPLPSKHLSDNYRYSSNFSNRGIDITLYQDNEKVLSIFTYIIDDNLQPFSVKTYRDLTSSDQPILEEFQTSFDKAYQETVELSYNQYLKERKI